MTPRPHSILLDAEALSALAAADRRMLAWTIAARRTDSVLNASTLTLAEITDGSGRDVRVRRAVRALRLVAVDDQIAYRAGVLRAAASASRRRPRDLTVDAVVAATALTLRPPTVVLTSDVDDLTALLAGSDVRVEGLG